MSYSRRRHYFFLPHPRQKSIFANCGVKENHTSCHNMNPGVHGHELLISCSVGSAYEFGTGFICCGVGMAKNPELQCIRMKLLTQPATPETNKHRFSVIKGLSIYEK